MRQNTPVAVSTLIASNPGGLGPLVQRAERLGEMQASLGAFLGPPANRHTRVANVAGSVLILHADSPVWSTRLRFLEPEILAFIRHRPGLEEVRSVQIRVRPPRLEPSPRKPKNRLSAAAASVVESVADTVENPDLQRVLHRLSTRV